MFMAAATGMFLALSLPNPSSALEAADRRELVVYRNLNLIDGFGGPARPGMALIVEGDTIREVVPDAKLKEELLADAKFVDLRGGYLLPGLIDSHQHMATPPNRIQAEAQLRRDLYGGITAVRDMGDDLRAVAEYQRAALAGDIEAPDIVYSVLMAGPAFFSDPRTKDANYGVKPGSAPWMQSVTDESDIPRAVARASGTSAYALKLYDDLPPERVLRLTQEAHRQGLKVWAHGMVFPTPPADVVASGVDVISHVCYLAYQVSDPRPTTYKDRRPVESGKLERGDNPEMTAIFRAMAAHGTVLDATLRVYSEYGRRLAANPDMSPRPYCSLALAVTLTRQAMAEGVTLVTGTDGVPPRTENFPALYDELTLFTEKLGMPPAQAIRSATFEGAKIIGLGDEMGSIEPGKLANFIVVRRNPLTSMENLKTIFLTVKRGKRFERSAYRPITAAEMPTICKLD